MESAKQKVPGYPDLDWCWYELEEMGPVLLYDLLALRESIFVVEQSCIYHELDGLDKTAEHLLVTQKEAVAACLRVLPPGGGEACFRIGRVAVSAAWRKRGLARLMVQKAIDRIRGQDPSRGVCVDAQTYLQGFYSSLGFHVCGDEFLEDGIAHIAMQL